MRPTQNNKRMRGRPNNNRKGPNPLTRSYESSGPDVKIRGTAHHISEKYLQLARDAQSSGDPVMAESYLQHAEHYFRLIAAAQLAQQQVHLSIRASQGKLVRKKSRMAAISAVSPIGSLRRQSVSRHRRNQLSRLSPRLATAAQS